MPLEARPIAIKIAVLMFFIMAFIGFYKELAPMECCKRAIIGSIIIYLVTAYAVKAVNFIVLSAIHSKQSSKKVNNAV